MSNFTYDWPLVGNQQITEFLEKSIQNNNISGTYIFNGPDNLGKTTLAKSFASALLCSAKESGSGRLPCGQCRSCHQFKQSEIAADKGAVQAEIGEGHGDFHVIKKEKDKKNISVEQIREFIRVLSMSSFLGGYKIGIIKHADSLSVNAANALLKTLEEPRPKVVIILIAEDMESLPATIASRARVLQFRSVPTDTIYEYLINEHKASRSQAKDLSRLALGRPALAVKFFENKDTYTFYQEQVNVFLDFKNQTIGERFLSIESLLGKKTTGQEAVRIAGRVLQVWQGALRDLLLMEYGFFNIIQHQITKEKLDALKPLFSLTDIFRLFKAIEAAEENIFYNVNPKLALEEVAVKV
ncbi:MAG: polymerase III, delta prime subunit protein [Candidatus Falkowbacteria bacterium GW2011_GWC2_38_22]|uniref:Polymerase III, delta prime subunit protein n=1 Tax=Candidatus Falkowbacteria bacterium GW2011_GWE1_38_31 TaxID=1618638 RepID=A0A0G0MZT4_9BACT|nr:MAG: polymerase III, delta prime subunit protein [Candidatus Falkowbacteria bacterium GW2011_GWF2_38_1205]KKQ61505.1 MAG: polymerase III, delta prime subunit protein [Candidatus Falkowbacteria bacterium GW2011_GWC2_38_22]KKQ63602.1 MAG: polymerase III, delta prime subunit protein [Candidatus Falkowbacteria bacterium GW2011_GWF1_38_22]KKQ65754.1 MAG: polymerase III, delta prime subunit protein [Candidatus Falkowbacteria bacterium GW2011_GWE2_38_254]KKQ70371.1 MAG: polymerase III, delta prime 